MVFNLNSFLISLSTALDCAEQEIMHITTHHSKRCAYMVLRIAQEMGMHHDESFDLCSLALMHDNGITQAFLKQNILNEGSDKNLSLLENLKEHCSIGEDNVKSFPFLTRPKNVILYHHEYLDGSGLYGKKGDEIPLMSQIISLVDDLDINFELLHTTLKNVDEINNFVITRSGKLFHEDIKEAFLRLSTQITFWRDLRDENIISALQDYLPDISVYIEPTELLAITAIFSLIIDAKSEFTAIHSLDLMDKAETISHHYKWDKAKSIKFQMAANLHDLGKLAMPLSILEKTQALSEEEFNTIKEHAYITHAILGNIEGFEEIHEWAASHHERLDGSGYPFGLTAKDLSFESKILASLDVYQALTENRPQRKALSHAQAMHIMHAQVFKGLLDVGIVKTIGEVFADDKKQIA